MGEAVHRPVGTHRHWELLTRMTQAIKESFRYVARTEMGIQDPVTTLSLRRGSCRDFALLMMEAVRTYGLAAQFVSGYLYDEKLIRGWQERAPASFRFALNEDAMATEKLAEGIRAFAADAGKLDKMIEGLA